MYGIFFQLSFYCVAAALVVSAITARGQEAAPKGPLTSVAEVRSLTSSEAVLSVPVRLKAVVTYHKLGTNQELIVQDADQGLFVRPDLGALPTTPISPGTEVEIEGVSHHETFAPGVLASRLQIIKMTTPPTPLKVNAAECLPGHHEARLLTIKGTVRRAIEDFSLDPPRLLLDLATPVGILRIWIIDYQTEDIHRFVDAEVEATGVHLTFNNARLQPIGHRLVSRTSRDIVITREAVADPFATELLMIHKLLRFNASGPDNHRVKVRGVVTWYQAGEGVYLQDKNAGVHVLTRMKPTVRIGDVVEAVGFATMGAGNAELHEGILKVLGVGEKIIPQKLIPDDELPKDGWDSSLVEVEGIVKRFEFGDESRGLLLVSGSKFIEAKLPSMESMPWPQLREGSRVRVTGVCQILLTSANRDHRERPDNFSLLLRTPADVQVLVAGPWWTKERLRNALIFGSFCFACLLIWALVRHRASHRLELEVVERVRVQDELVKAQTELEGERHRLAAELHDSFHQTLVGAIHQLDLLTAKVNLSPDEVLRHCALARNLVSKSQSEARASVWDLRTQSSERVDLECEFHEVVKFVAMGRAVPVHITSEGESKRLSRLAEEQLLRLGQEAVVNALNHASARKVSLHLEYTDTCVLLRIQDDGIGFDPENVPGVRQGHFGLVGMRERVLRIGGHFLLESKLGEGTTIQIEVPIAANRANA